MDDLITQIIELTIPIIGLYFPISYPTAYLPVLYSSCPKLPHTAAAKSEPIIWFKALVAVVSIPEGSIGAQDSKDGIGIYSYAILI